MIYSEWPRRIETTPVVPEPQVATPNHYRVTPLWNAEYRPKLIEEINQAKQSIRVVMYQLEYESADAHAVMDALGEAVKRGVDARVILSRGTFANFKLEKSNKKSVEYLRLRGVNAWINDVPNETHTKLVGIDDRVVFTGAHNISHGAMRVNNELSLMIESEEPDERPKAYFEKLVERRRQWRESRVMEESE